MKTYKAFDLINPKSEFFKVLRKLPTPTIEGPWIAGGSVWKAMEDMPLECDIDFFFKDEAQLYEIKRVMNSMPYIHRILKEKQNRFNTTYDFHVHDRDYEKTIKIQFISFKQWFTPKELLNDFDFTACQFLFDGNEIHVGDDSIEHLKARKIILNRVKKSELALFHLQKYLDKGFTISDEQKKLLEDLKVTTDKEIVRNQHTGNIEVTERTDNEDWTNYGREIPFDVGNNDPNILQGTQTIPQGTVNWFGLNNNQYITGNLGNYGTATINPTYYETITLGTTMNVEPVPYLPYDGNPAATGVETTTTD